jgi:hypothetical protein
MPHEEITPCKEYYFALVVAALSLFGIMASTAYYANEDYHSKREIEVSSSRTDRLLSENIRLKSEATIDDYELFVTTLTLFGSAKRPGETHLNGDDTQAQLAVLNTAQNRANVCGTHYTDEFLKFGYDKSRKRDVAMFSVWENGGPVIGYADLKRFSRALSQARKVILLSRTTSPDTRVTHYHQTGMKSPPAWSKIFHHVKDAGGNSFYQEESESGSYCKAFVPKAIPIPVKVKPRIRKKKSVVAGGDGDKVKAVDERIEKIRSMLREEAGRRRKRISHEQ